MFCKRLQCFNWSLLAGFARQISFMLNLQQEGSNTLKLETSDGQPLRATLHQPLVSVWAAGTACLCAWQPLLIGDNSRNLILLWRQLFVIRQSNKLVHFDQVSLLFKLRKQQAMTSKSWSLTGLS